MQRFCHTLESFGRKGTDLDIADDLVLFTNKSKLIQLMTDWLKNISKKVGLKIIINDKKSSKRLDILTMMLYS